MIYDIYTEIVINISRKKNDNQDEFLRTAHDILMKLGGHERDELWLSRDEEHPYMNHNLYPELESVWRFRFVTKNIQNRHRKIFKKLQQQFLDRNIYCPYEEDGWRLLLTRLTKYISAIRNFIENINFQRLNEEEKKIFQKMKKKYKFAFEPNNIRHSIQKLMRKKDMLTLIKKFNIISYLRKLENNPEINTSKAKKAVDDILEILNAELFISQFEWVYKDTNKSWKKEFGWYLFKTNDFIDSLKIPKDNKEFNSQLQDLYKLLVESLNNEDIKKSLKKLDVKGTELKGTGGKMKKSIALLELWIIKKLKKNNLEIIEFLKLLNKIRGKTSHSLKIDVSKTKEFKEIVEFCKKKHSIKSYSVHEVFKAILKTSEVLLEKELCHFISV